MQEKKLTLKSAFVEVFGEGLAPLGFVRLKKTKLPFFVRLINGEILQIVTYRQLSAKKIGYKRLEVLGGIVSLYRNTISFENEPQLWLKTNGQFYRSECAVPVDDCVKKRVIEFNCDIWGTSMKMYSEPERLEDGFTENIYTFLCKADDNEEMLKGLQNAFEVTRSIMVSIFEKVTDLHSSVEYFYQMHENMWLCDNMEEFKVSNSEGLTMIVSEYRDNFVPFMEHWLAKEVKEIENGTRGAAGAGSIDVYWERGRKRIQERVEVRDRLLNTPHLHALAIQEADRRKAVNTELLRAHGLPL